MHLLSKIKAYRGKRIWDERIYPYCSLIVRMVDKKGFHAILAQSEFLDLPSECGMKFVRYMMDNETELRALMDLIIDNY